MNAISVRNIFSLIASMVLATSAYGQFDQVIDLPLDPVPYFVDSNTQLNIFDMGELPNNFTLGDIFGTSDNIELNLFAGGSIGSNLMTSGGIIVNVAGGEIGDDFTVGSLFAPSTTVVNLSNGSIGDDYESIGGTTNVSGGSFGIFAIFQGSTINLTGGSLGEFSLMFGSDVSIDGGFIPDNGSVGTGSNANMTAGTINNEFGSSSDEFEVRSGSTFSMSGGRINKTIEINNSSFNLTGGAVERLVAISGGQVNIEGGVIEERISLQTGSQADYSGGLLAPFFSQADTTIDVSGNDFEVDGVPVGDGALVLPEGSILSGLASDGSIFLFNNSPDQGQTFAGQVNLTQTDIPERSPMEFDISTGTIDNGLIEGDVLNLSDQGSVSSNFNALKATLNVSGGEIDRRLRIVDSTGNFSGGSVASDFQAFLGSVVNIDGGRLSGVEAFGQSTVNLNVGGFLFKVVLNDGSTFNMTGSDFATDGSGGSIRVFTESTVNISGGRLGNDNGFNIRMFAGTTLNLVGASFSLFDLETDTLIQNFDSDLDDGQRLTIEDRDVRLSGILADGTPLSLDLNSTDAIGSFFAAGSQITIGRLAVEPSVLGDVNGDGLVSFLDIAPFIALLADSAFQDQADIDRNGIVDFFDIAPFIEILSGP